MYLKVFIALSIVSIAGCATYVEPTAGSVAKVRLVNLVDGATPSITIHPNGMCNPRILLGAIGQYAKENKQLHKRVDMIDKKIDSSLYEGEMIVQAGKPVSFGFHALAPDGTASSCDIAVTFTPDPLSNYILNYKYDYSEKKCIIQGAEMKATNEEIQLLPIDTIKKEKSSICLL